MSKSHIGKDGTPYFKNTGGYHEIQKPMPETKKEDDIIAVAIFMGWQRGLFENLPNKLHKMEDGELLGMPIDQFNYNTSWDALIPVVKNIALSLSKTGGCSFSNK